MQHPERSQAFQTCVLGINVAIPVTGHFDFSSLRNTAEEEAKGHQEKDPNLIS